MIRLKVKEWCEERGVLYNGHLVDSGYRLKLAVALNSPTTANQIWKAEMRKIGLETIEELCRSLGCQPNDLFEFDPPLAQSTPAVKYQRPDMAKETKRKARRKPIKKKAKEAEPQQSLPLLRMVR